MKYKIEKNIPCDLTDIEWFTKIDASNGVVFSAFLLITKSP